MPFGIGPGELVILVVIVLIIFGAGRLPEIGRALGQNLRDLRNALREPSTKENDAPDSHTG